jgi:hypothetical protein
MAMRVLKKIHKRLFIGLHLGRLFGDQISPYYTMKLGTYTYHYFITIDLLNEALLSVSTTSSEVIKRIKESITSGGIEFVVGKYALTYQDRILTCGSLKLLSSERPEFKNTPELLRDAIKFAERFAKGTTLYSQLAAFPLYITRGSENLQNLYNTNSAVIVSPEGHTCYAGFLFGIITSTLISRNIRDNIGKLPHVEYYPGIVVNVKSVACRPELLNTDSTIRCHSIRSEALISKSIIPQLILGNQNITSRLACIMWCPKLEIEKPILIGFKTLNNEELANFIFGKSLLLSTLETINEDKAYRIYIPEERLQKTYKSLVNEIKYRLGMSLDGSASFENIISEHEKRGLLLRFHQKEMLLPITMEFYLRTRKLLNSSIRNLILAKKLNDVIYLNKRDSKKLIGFSSRVWIIRPLSREDKLMII